MMAYLCASLMLGPEMGLGRGQETQAPPQKPTDTKTTPKLRQPAAVIEHEAYLFVFLSEGITIVSHESRKLLVEWKERQQTQRLPL